MKSIDFKLRKVWVGDDSELRTKVENKLREHGIIMSESACCKTDFSCLWIPSANSTFGTYGQNFTREQFEKDTDKGHIELTVQELLKEELVYEIF